MKRRFVEATRFTTERERMEHAGELTHDDLVALEQAILANPEAGDLVPGTGGFRKIRIASGLVPHFPPGFLFQPLAVKRDHVVFNFHHGQTGFRPERCHPHNVDMEAVSHSGVGSSR